MSLTDYGWDSGWQDASEALTGDLPEGVEPGRVLAEHGESYRVRVEAHEIDAQVAGSLKHRAVDRRDLPAVGDWVLLDSVSGDAGRVRAVIPRKSVFVRRAAGEVTVPQVVAANVDTVAIVSAFGRDINPRRIERYLAVAWESGASPILVLTKLDLSDDPLTEQQEVESVAFGVPLFAVSNETGEGLDPLRSTLVEGQTIALLGSSGVGKSTLLNRLLGYEAFATGSIRESDGRGRHTTSHRQLVRADSGLLLIDTPGMRELQPWDASGSSTVFEDVEQLAIECHFSDCRHVVEPGCALRRAVETGDLELERVESFLKLKSEAERLEMKKDHRARLADKQFTKMIHRALRDHPKYNR